MRHTNDFYPTPLESFYPIIQHLNIATPIWEPACGDKRLINCLCNRGYTAAGDDIINGYNYLSDATFRPVVLTNPPFSLAFQFCKQARKFSTETWFLLRLNFLASTKRAEWFKANEPDALFVLSKRPSFTADKATDMTDYAWYYWGPRIKGIFHI